VKRRIQVCAAIRNHHELVIGIAGVQQRREDHAARRDPEQHERVDVSRMENHFKVRSEEWVHRALRDDDVARFGPECGMDHPRRALEQLLMPRRGLDAGK